MSGDAPLRPEFATATARPLAPPLAVDVWRIRLDAAAGRLASLERLLSADEQARAARFGTAALRRRYVARHGALRVILARYLGEEPAGLAFGTASGGRPHLAPPAHLDFSLADSADLALLAVAAEDVSPVGVDVERVRPVIDAEEIAARWFSPASQDLLRRLPQVPTEARDRAFFEGWTRLEAAMKALGAGFGSQIPEEGKDKRHVRSLCASALVFEPEDGYVGALAPGIDPARVRWLDAP